VHQVTNNAESSWRHAAQKAIAASMSDVRVPFENSIALSQLQIPPYVAVCMVGCAVRSQRTASDRGRCMLGSVDSSCCAAESMLGIKVIHRVHPDAGRLPIGQ